MHVGTSPDHDSRADVADHPSCEDGAVDDRQDRRLDRQSVSRAEASLKVRRNIELCSQVECCRVVSIGERRHRCCTSEVCNEKFPTIGVASGDLILRRLFVHQ